MRPFSMAIVLRRAARCATCGQIVAPGQTVSVLYQVGARNLVRHPVCAEAPASSRITRSRRRPRRVGPGEESDSTDG